MKSRDTTFATRIQLLMTKFVTPIQYLNIICLLQLGDTSSNFRVCSFIK
eukprot:UN08300